MTKNKILIGTLSLLLLALAIFTVWSGVADHEKVDRTDGSTQTTENELPPEEEIPTEEPAVAGDDGVLDCTDCWLAPVDKVNSLSSSYAPTVVALNLSGGGYMTTPAAENLRALFTAAEADGVTMSVRSAYRSYQTQIATFEKWVGEEMALGYSRAEAEERANMSSARAGHSEHQLGTAVDILCSGCDFDSTPSNEVIWTWLRDNAVSYGFVLSYPEGRTDETGYIYEPWHWRFIGKDKAPEFNSQTELTLNKWLTEN